MGACCSDSSKEKPIEIVHTKNPRECIDKFVLYASVPKNMKDKDTCIYVYQFMYKDAFYEIIKKYSEPRSKVVQTTNQKKIRMDEWDLYLLKKVQDNRPESKELKEQDDSIKSKDSKKELLLMMTFKNIQMRGFHEKQSRIFEKLIHPNLVQYLFHCKVNFQLNLFKEFCSQGNLIDFLVVNSRYLNADFIFDMIEDFCSALEYLYSRSIFNFELNLDMLYINENVIKIDLYNSVKFQEDENDDGYTSKRTSEQMANNLVTSKIVLPPSDFLDATVMREKGSRSTSVSKVRIGEQSRTFEKTQQMYQVDKDKIDIELLRRFCLFLIFNQDYSIMVKEKKSMSELDDEEMRQLMYYPNLEFSKFQEIDLDKIKAVKKAPKQLKEFIVWTMHHIKSLRPHLGELHREIRKIRYSPEVITYINHLYSKNKNSKGDEEQQADERLEQYKSHYLEQHQMELKMQEQQKSNKSCLLNQELISTNQNQKQRQVEESVQNEINNTDQNSLNIDIMSLSHHSIHNTKLRTSQNTIKIWEEVGENPVEKVRCTLNPNTLLNKEFSFFDETYVLKSFLGYTELGMLFRVENIFNNRQKAFTLKVVKNDQDNLYLEKEYTILKQFGCQNIIKAFSQVYIQGLSGIVLELYNQNMHTYLLNSSKLDIAAQLIDYLQQFLNGLHELHIKQIIHRQLSLEAISIISYTVQQSKKTCSALTNMEMAIQLRNSDSINGSIPINLYSSPEIKEGTAYGIQSDIYSAGIIILSTLCNVSANKLQSIATPSSQRTLTKDSRYVSNYYDPNLIQTKSHYQKALEQSQVRRLTETQQLTESKRNTFSNINNQNMNCLTDNTSLSKHQLNSLNNILTSSTSKQVNTPPLSTSNQNRNMSRFGSDWPQSNQTTFKIDATKLNNHAQSLREALGDKCPELIIETFSNMIQLEPDMRGQCSDYLNAFSKLKESPEVINYINIQNKQIRFI